MTVLSVKAKNYKKLKSLHINPNGKSFFVVGDTEEGKSTLLEIIESSLQLAPFPSNPLSDDEDAGGYEVVHLLNGEEYTVKREFTREGGLKRFTMTDRKGFSAAPSTVLNNIFGKAFINAHFDYKAYFYGCTTSFQRTEYVIKAFGGNTVLENIKIINTKTRERGAIGTDKTTFETLLKGSILNPETLELDLLKYAEPKDIKSAYGDPEYLRLQEELVDKDKLELDLSVISDFNKKHDITSQRNIDIADRIKLLEQEIKDLKGEKKDNEKWLKDNPKDLEFEQEIIAKIDEADLFNEAKQTEIDTALQLAIDGINLFNQNKFAFDTGITYLEKFQELDEKWDELDKEITELEEINDKILHDSLPIPELSIVNDVIMYEGRELCFPNISKGRSIRITAQIQRILNPKGNNLIIIPEGQSLGSGLDEVIEECKNFGVQYIVEITERKQPFQIKFEDEFLKKD